MMKEIEAEVVEDKPMTINEVYNELGQTMLTIQEDMHNTIDRLEKKIDRLEKKIDKLQETIGSPYDGGYRSTLFGKICKVGGDAASGGCLAPILTVAATFIAACYIVSKIH